MGRPNKGQHKVPRTYLEAFTDSDGFLWVGNNEGKIYRDKPHNVLTERDYYTIRFPSGGGSLIIETEFLGGIEAAFADIYRRKLATRQQLDDQEKGVMAIFLASMMERGPRRREAMQQFFDEIKKRTEAMRAMVDRMTPEEKEDYARLLAPNRGDRRNAIPASEWIEAGKDVPSLHSSEMPRMVAAIAPILYDMQWGFMTRDEGTDPFLTSDNPALMVNPTRPYRSFYGPGLGQNDVEVSLPLSPDLALLVGWQIEYDRMYIPVGAEAITELNCRLMRFADALICNDKSILEREEQRVRKFLATKGTTHPQTTL